MNLVLDFDSTICQLEGLDELTKLVAAATGRPDLSAKVERITDMGMSGQIGFAASLAERVALLDFNASLLTQLIDHLKQNLTTSFVENIEALRVEYDSVTVISGGFIDFIEPVLVDYNFTKDDIYANKFIFDAKGNLLGLDTDNLLAHDNGKVRTVERLDLGNNVLIVGDGYTDYQIKQAGLASKFIAYVEHQRREKVVAVADEVITDFGQLLPSEKLD